MQSYSLREEKHINQQGRLFWWLLPILVFSLMDCQDHSNSWDIKIAKEETERLLIQAETMLSYGKEGELDKMAFMAKEMKKTTRFAIDAIPPTISEGKKAIRNLKVVHDEIESVIVHSRKGHLDNCLLHGEKALSRIRKALLNVQAL